MEVFKKLLLFIQTKLVSINGDMQKLNNHFSDSDWQDIIVNSPNVGTMLLGNYRKKNGIVTVTMQSQEVGYELLTNLHNATPVTIYRLLIDRKKLLLFHFMPKIWIAANI